MVVAMTVALPALVADLPSGRGRAAAAAGAEVKLQSTRVLVGRLAAAGRGECAITVTVADLMGGADRVDRGRLALEPPDRARLDFATGEKLAVRGDGGEWVQPLARQVIRMSREQVGLAAWLWETFMKGGQSDFTERALGGRRYELTPRAEAVGLPERVTVTVDARGLPAAIEFEEAGGGLTRYRFAGWRFRAARGAAVFKLATPPGYAVIEMP
jgi:hypothetical protein